jgi:hypothetical protein
MTLAGQQAAADHTPLPDTVTLVGSLQSELGCPGDWQPSAMRRICNRWQVSQGFSVARLPCRPATQTLAATAGQRYALHPAAGHGSDPVVKIATYNAATGQFTVPPRTVAVFAQR